MSRRFSKSTQNEQKMKLFVIILFYFTFRYQYIVEWNDDCGAGKPKKKKHFNKDQKNHNVLIADAITAKIL